MAIEVDVFPKTANVETYSVSEDAIALAPGDLGAGVGSIDISGDSFTDDVFLLSNPMTLADERRGSTVGKITSISDAPGGLSLSGFNVLNQFNVIRTVPPSIPSTAYNLSTNPSFETASASGEAARNFAVNPKPTATAAWTPNYQGGTGSVSYTTGSGIPAGSGVTEYARMTWATAASSLGGGLTSPLNTSVPPGTYRASMWVRSSLAQNVKVAFTGTAVTSGLSGDIVTTVGATWTYILVSFTITGAGTLGISASGWTTGHQWAIGETFDISSVKITRGAYDSQYFDGSTSFSALFTPSWIGTANNSDSILTITGVARTVNGVISTIAYTDAPRTNTWSHAGTYSMASFVIPKDGLGNHQLYTEAAPVAGTYTAQIRKRLATTQLSGPGARIYATYTTPGGIVSTYSARGSLAAGEEVLSVSFTLPAGSTSLQVWVNAELRALTDIMYWDELLVTRGVYSGTYFDGSTTPVAPYTYAWAGTANQSTSTRNGALTFGGAFTDWCALVGISSVTMDPTIANRVVNAYPGWNGNVWEMVKSCLTAEQLELYTVGSTVGVRLIRSTSTDIANVTDLSESVEGDVAARYVQVNYYNNTFISQKEIFPIAGQVPQVYQVGAGETLEFNLDLPTYLSTVNQPICVNLVQPAANFYDGTNGVYAVIKNSNLPYPAAQWNAYGGSITTSITGDSSVLHVKIVGANDPVYAPFRIAMYGDSAYPALRITGSGTQTLSRSVQIATGADPTGAVDVEPVEIDNPFISTLGQAINLGGRAAAQYMGVSQTISAGTANYDADFGTLPGARILQTGANFRVTNATYNAEGMTIEAQSDTTMNDLTGVWKPADTMGMLQTEWAGKTFKEWTLRPLRRVNV